MKTYKFVGAHLYTEKQIIENPVIQIENGKIFSLQTEWEFGDNEVNEVISFSKPVRIVPGFIDVHIHGAEGADVMDGTKEAIIKMQKVLPKEGTTSFLATTITNSEENKLKALHSVKAAMNDKSPLGAEVLGVHLEGPFISKARAGAQPHDDIQKANVALFKQFQEACSNQIKLVTMAPEEDKEGKLTKELIQQRVISSIGHSDATYEQVIEAVGRGMNHVTHLFNGMRGVHHRDIGVAGGALLHDELKVEMIVDGIHISPAMVKLAYKNKGDDHIILITDAMRAKGLEPGKSSLGGQDVYVSEDRAVLEDGTLAGSILKMNEAIKNMMVYTGCSFREALQMATINPAKQLRIDDRKGSLSEGKDADFCILDEDLDVIQTYVNGTKVYTK